MAHRRSRSGTPRSAISTPLQHTIHQPYRYPSTVLRTLQTLKKLEALRVHQEPLNDLRRYSPSKIARPRTRSANAAGLNHRRLSTLYQSPWTITIPGKVSICIRRKQRREVLHALRRTGKGSRSERKYTPNSEYRCK